MGGRARSAGKSDGGDPTSHERHHHASQCSVPPQQIVPAWTRCAGSGETEAGESPEETLRLEKHLTWHARDSCRVGRTFFP